MRRAARTGSSRFVRIVVVFSVVLLVFVFIFTMIVTKPVERLMRHQAEIRLSRALGVTVHVGGLETDLFTRVQIRDVDVCHRDGTRFLRLKYGRVNFRIWDFLRHDILFRAVFIDSLFITVKRDSVGRLVSPFVMSDKDTSRTATSPRLRIRVGKMSIQHATILYDDRQIPLQGAMYGVGVACEQRESYVYHWSASSDSARFISRGKHLPVVKLNAAGIFSPECREVRSLEIKTPKLTLSGQALGETGGQSSKLQGTFVLKGRVDGVTDFFDNTFLRSLSSSHGELDLKVNLEGRWSNHQLSGEFRIRDARLGGIVIPDGQIRMSCRDSLISLEHLEISMMGGRIFGNGYMVWDSLMDHRLSLNAQGVQFPNLWKIIHQDSVPTDGVFSGRWISSGPVKSVKNVHVESHLNLTRSRYRNKPLQDLNIRLSSEAGTADILVVQGENRLEGDLRLSGGHGEGVFRFDIRRAGSLAELMNIDHFSGSFRGDGRIIGGVKNPEISMEVRGEDLRYQNFPMDSLQLYTEYRDGQLFIQSGSFSGRYASKESPCPLFNHARFQGDILYRGIFSGPVDNLRGEIQAKVFSPEFGDFCFDEGDLRIKVLQSQVCLDALTLRKDSLWVLTQGEFQIPFTEGRLDVSVLEGPKNERHAFAETEGVSNPPAGFSRLGLITANFDQESNKGWHLKAKGRNIQLDKMMSFYREKTDWRGRLGFDLALSDTTHMPQGLLRMWADSVGTGQAVLDSVKGTIQLRENRVTAAPLEFYLGGRKSWTEADFELVRKVSGGYTLTDESKIRGRAEGSGIDLRFLAPLLGLGAELSGISEYELEWNGHWGRPRIRGHLDVTNGQIRIGPGDDPIQLIEARLSLADSLLKIGPVSGKIREIPFRIEGRVIGRNWRNFRMDAKLDVSGVETMALEGSKNADSLDFRMGIHDLNLSLFNDFIPAVRQLYGRLSSQMKISGHVDSPQLTGFVELRSLLLHPKALDQSLSAGIIKATFESNKIVLDSLYFKMNGGTILAGGNTTLSGREITNLDAWIAVDRVNMNRAEKFSLAIQSIRAGMKKENDAYSIDGNIILGECRMMQDVQPGVLLSFFQKVERPTAAPSVFLRSTRINLRVLESDKLWIDNNIARLRLHSELGFIGTLAHPNLSGRLSVEEGYILYLDRKFQVQQGVLDFLDPYRINPMVDFKAQTDIKSYQTWSRQPYTVSLGIQGPLNHTVMDLSSSPPLDRPDIITLLTVGATREQLVSRNEAGKSSLGNVLEDRVGHLSSRQISGFASRRIGNLFGLKEMSIEGNLFRFGKSWGPQLLASKKITDRMAISYTTRVGHANEQSIRLDYRLSRILSIEGQTDQQGRSGIDFKFRWKFK